MKANVNQASPGFANNLLSRVQNLSFNSATVANYAYLGLSAVINVNYPQPGVTMALNDGLGNYPGLDLFGRVVDVPWTKLLGTSSSSSSSSSSGIFEDLVNLGYGYDQASNRTYRQDFVAKSYGQPFDEKYENDGLYRLKKFQRGTLVGGVITSPGLQQAWNLDATGNWKDFAQFDPANNATNTFDQQRTSNAANEIIDLMPTVGGTWAKPGYDRNGNMTTMPQPNNPTSGYTATPDAWNRLMKLVDSTTGLTVQQNQYDGRNFRTTRQTFSGGTLTDSRDFYYSSAWQVLYELIAGGEEIDYVWGLRYIDDLVLRNGPATQLYAMQDANWNVVAICDDTGNVQERYAYTAYGVCTVLNPDFSVKIGGTAYDWTVLFTGRALDWATGLQDSRNRFYLALLGVFVSRDPIFATNLFQYVRSNPAILVDPFGLSEHHWLPQLGKKGQVLVDAICCGKVKVKIDDFTTWFDGNLKGGKDDPTRTPHSAVQHLEADIPGGYNAIGAAIYATAESCCDLLYSFSVLINFAWTYLWLLNMLGKVEPRMPPVFEMHPYGDGKPWAYVAEVELENGTVGKFNRLREEACKGKQRKIPPAVVALLRKLGDLINGLDKKVPKSQPQDETGMTSPGDEMFVVMGLVGIGRAIVIRAGSTVVETVTGAAKEVLKEGAKQAVKPNPLKDAA